MTVLEIVREYLKENGYDGLCNPELECGCGLDDLAPCGEMGMDCEPAYVAESPEDPDHDYLYFPTERERDYYLAITGRELK